MAGLFLCIELPGYSEQTRELSVGSHDSAGETGESSGRFEGLFCKRKERSESVCESSGRIRDLFDCNSEPFEKVEELPDNIDESSDKTSESSDGISESSGK